MKNKFLNLILFSFLVSQAGMAKNNLKVDSLMLNLKQKYNVALNQNLIDISYDFHKDTIFFQGAVSNPSILEDIRRIGEIDNQFIIVEDIKTLPDSDLVSTPYGLINVSVADLRTTGRFSSGMATQELLGTPVKLLEEKNGWIRIQSPNLYFGWIPARQLVKLNEANFTAWVNAKKISFNQHYGVAYKAPQIDKYNIVSDLVLNDVLVLLGEENDFYKVEYPDKRIGFVLKSEAKLFETTITQALPSTEDFIATIMSLNGVPYVWGGKSTKGVDCSGLVNTALRDWGLLTLRDASQQALVGEFVEIAPGYANLQRGDLMFFGSSDNNIRHVGVYLGDNQFIHASGYVRISSLNPNDSNFDELNTKEFAFARRYLNDGKMSGAWKISDSPFYKR